jgi:hypothetical protein
MVMPTTTRMSSSPLETVKANAQVPPSTPMVTDPENLLSDPDPNKARTLRLAL